MAAGGKEVPGPFPFAALRVRMPGVFADALRVRVRMTGGGAGDGRTGNDEIQGSFPFPFAALRVRVRMTCFFAAALRMTGVFAAPFPCLRSETWGTQIRGWVVAGLVGVWAGGSVPCRAATPAAKVRYQISGVALSTRDGSPVPYCRITAMLVAGAEEVAARAAAARGPSAGGGAGGPQPFARGARPMGGRGPSEQPEVTADESGRFTLELPHGGAWRVTGAARGFRGQSYDEHEGFYSAVVLTEASPTYAMTFKMAPDSSIDGLIFDDSGEPVVGAQVLAELVPVTVPGVPQSANAPRPRQAGLGVTDDRGAYEVEGLAPGEYRLRVTAHPWYSRPAGQTNQGNASTAAASPPLDPSLDFVYPTTWFPGTDEETAAQTITLGAGEERQVDMHLTAIPSVHLRIRRTDVPQPAPTPPPTPGGIVRMVQPPQLQRGQATVTRISSDGEMPMQQMQTGGTQNGSEWDFGGLSPGVYEVRLPPANGRGEGEVEQLEVRAGSQPVITMEGAKPLNRVTIAIDGLPEREVQTVEFVDTETGQRVNANWAQRGRQGGPPQWNGDGDGDADPYARPEQRPVLLASHTYEVLLGGGGAYLTGISAKGAKAAGRVVTIDGAATLTLHVANGRGTVEGVARIAGKAAEGAMVLLVPATLGEPDSFSAVQRDETNTDGTFLISGVVPGKYILVAIDRGWEVKWISPETLAQYLLHGVPVEVKTGGTVSKEVGTVAP